MTDVGAIASEAAVIEPDSQWNASSGGEEMELRMLELRHRIKNILGVVQSLVNQTLRDGVSMADAREVLARRLVAVGHAVDLLLSGAWESTPLKSLIRSAMTTGTDRIMISGPAVQIGPSASMMLSILFHELECNAIKYGALSNGDGRVAVTWSLSTEDPQALIVHWIEQGGPPIEAPAQKGFGSKLISRIAARFDGEAIAEFAPKGLLWRLSAPLASLKG